MKRIPRAAPFIALLLIIAVSALLLGSDAPAAALFFSAVIALFSAALCLFHRGPVSVLAAGGLAGAAALFLVGVFQNWVGTGAGEYAVLAAAFGVFAAAQIAGRDPETLKTLWRTVLVVGAVISALSFLHFVGPRDFLADLGYNRSRLSAPFLSANTAATFYGLFAILSLCDLIAAVRRFDARRRGGIDAFLKAAALPGACLLLTLTCVFLTASRAGVTLLAAALLALVFWDLFRGVKSGGKFGWKNAGFVVGAGVLAAMVFSVSGDLYADRFAQTPERADGRAVTFPVYLEAIWLAPVFGHGLGGFVFINALVADAQNALMIMYQGAAHNIALQWLLQAGFVGLGFVLAVSAGWLALLRKGLARRSRQTGYIRAALVAAVFTAAHGMFDFALEIPGFLFLFAFVCGLGAGAASGGSRTLKPGGRSVSRALTYFASAILLVTAGLSAAAFLDRAGARGIAAMEEAPFRALFDDEGALHGSAVRLEAIGDRALRLDPTAPAFAASAFDLAISKEPRDGVLHAKFAYARYLEMGFLTPDAAAALSRSYLRMPYGPRDFALWRLNFVDMVWSRLPSSIKDAALREARAYNQRARIETWSASSGTDTGPYAP